MAVIYRITNMINNKYYIGSAESFARREWQHKYNLKRGDHKNPHLQASWNKYGGDAFVFEVLAEVPIGEPQLVWEDKYLAVHVGRPECYNINTGAEAPRLGIPMSEASKQKLSVNRIGKHAGAEHYRYGQMVSPEVRQKIGDTQRGVSKPKRTEEHRRNLSIATKGNQNWVGKTHTEESKNKLRRAVLAKLPDGQTRTFGGLSIMRDDLGVSIATTIRACGSGKPIKSGVLAGWVLSYADAAPNQGPDIPEEYAGYPRTRQAAKAIGAKEYFTGMPCSYGHVAPRMTKGACKVCLVASWKIENAKRSARNIDTQ